ncbi:hypothetical protein [Corynebacterium sp. 13CS0277]|uniref:hypothetical protein n=1 Tax=Corynebacterium sp. 13CS0277 TaxID=2071994 RepID=UPI001E4C47D4|nr:hypothetical protein [Corynebacterium sp. 13CS0277]
MAAAVVLVLLVLLIVGIISLFTGGEEEPAPEAAAVTSTRPAAAQSEDVQASEVTTAPAEPTTTSSTPPAAPAKKTCALEDLVITANSDRPSYDESTQPTFYMTVKNPTAADCTIDLGKDVLRFEVYDMHSNRRVWSDVDCNPPEDSRTRTFAAGAEVYYEAQWSRTTSAPNACKDRQPVPAGAYYLHTLVGSNHSDAHPFNLR